MVIWVTGLSGAGKTTLCDALRDLVKPRLPELVVLDGDVVRAAFGHNLGYAEAERVVQVKRLQSMSKVLAEQGLAVIVGVLYAHPDLLAWNRANLPGYFEVYLKASMETVKSRDTKGLYAAAEDGRMSDVVGMDIPWHAPERPDMIIDEDLAPRPERSVRELALLVPRLRAALPREEPVLRDIG